MSHTEKGACKKPYLFNLVFCANDKINPAFLPSLVSIGHILPKWLGFISLIFNPAFFLSSAPTPKELIFLLWLSSDKGFVSSIIWDSWLDVKNFFIVFDNRFGFISCCIKILFSPFFIFSSTCSILSFMSFIISCNAGFSWFAKSSPAVRILLFFKSSIMSIFLEKKLSIWCFFKKKSYLFFLILNPIVYFIYSPTLF